MQVKTMIAHENAVAMPPVGKSKYHKPKGAVYEHPDPQHLIDQGIVEQHGAEAEQAGE